MKRSAWSSVFFSAVLLVGGCKSIHNREGLDPVSAPEKADTGNKATLLTNNLESSDAEAERKVLLSQFKSVKTEVGGGTWYDSEGNKGKFMSMLQRGKSVKVRKCKRGMIGCYERASMSKYIIHLDDGRSDWFLWMASPPVVVTKSTSGSGAVNMKFDAARIKSGNSSVITVEGAGYKLTLKDEKIKNAVPQIIVLQRKCCNNLLEKENTNDH